MKTSDLEKRPILFWLARIWWATPFTFWGCSGSLWDVYVWQKFRHRKGGGIYQPGEIRAPVGGVLESIFRRRRRCVACGKYFWRQGAFNPARGVNIFEEHCSGLCADEESGWLPY